MKKQDTPKTMVPRPIVKWAGGKRLLLPELINRTPNKFADYYEPFLGGGAYFFALYNLGKISNATLSDLNSDLIWLYSVIKNDVDEFIETFNNSHLVSNKDTFYRIRREFNEAKENEKQSIIQAVRLLYLNKTCFNGLYRVNSKDQFNVPFGGYKSPSFFEETNLRSVSNALKNTTLECYDFEHIVLQAKEGSFIYFDPPYAPISDTSDFTSYTKVGFSFEEQKRLASVYSKLDKKKCYVMESNSAAEAIRTLYSKFYITEVRAARAISADGSKRGKIKELLITNYEQSMETYHQSSITIQTELSDY